MFCAAFKDSSLEWSYLHQPDFIFKSSMLLAWGIGGCLIFIQIACNRLVCVECIVLNAIAFSFLTSLLFIAWYKKLCWWQYGHNNLKKYSKLSCIVFQLLENIQHSFLLRITIYIMLIVCYYIVIALILVSLDIGSVVLNSKFWQCSYPTPVHLSRKLIPTMNFLLFLWKNRMSSLVKVAFSFTCISLNLVFLLQSIGIRFQLRKILFFFVFIHKRTLLECISSK